MKANKDDSVTFRVRKTLKDRIEFIAQIEERSVSQTIGRTIERWVHQAEEFYRDNGSVWERIEELRSADSGFAEVRTQGKSDSKTRKPGGKPAR